MTMQDDSQAENRNRNLIWPWRAGYRQLHVRATLVLICLLLAWLAFNCFATAHRIVDYYVPLPAWDYWRIYFDLHDRATAGWTVFFRAHNGHRIVFPEAVFLVDTFVFRGRMVLPIVVSCVCYLITWFALGAILWRDRSIPAEIRVAAALMACIVMGWKASAFVLGDPFLLQWTLCNMCAVLAFAMITRLRNSLTRALVPSLVSATVATFSSANGLLCWPLLFFLGYALRLSRRQMAAVAGTACVSIAAYFTHYHADKGPGFSVIAQHPFWLFRFVGTYVSMPFGDIKSQSFAAVMGGLCVIAFAIVLIRAIHFGQWRSSAALPLFAIYLFVLGSAMLTSIGRMDTDAFGFLEARAARYRAVPLLGWAVLILLCNWTVGRRKNSAAAWATNAVFAALLLLGTAKLRWILQSNDNDFAMRQFGALSIENGLRDPALAARLFPDPLTVLTFVDYLSEHQLALYSVPDPYALGKPLGGNRRIEDGIAKGGISYLFPVESGLEVVGWAAPDHKSSEQVIFLNQNEDVAGTGRSLPALFPLDLRKPSMRNSIAWVGFVNLKYAQHSVRAFLETRTGLQQIGPSIPLNNELERVARDNSELVPDVEWQMDKTWTTPGLPRVEYPGIAPHGVVYGSWSGSDRNTGRIVSSPIDVGRRGCLIIPVLHGRSVGGLSLQVRDPETNMTLVAVPMQNGDITWAYWKLRLSGEAKRIRIVGEDVGTGWNQWLALGAPTLCEAAAANVE